MFRIGLHLGEVDSRREDPGHLRRRRQHRRPHPGSWLTPGGIAVIARRARRYASCRSDCTPSSMAASTAPSTSAVMLQIYHVHSRESASGALARKMGVTLRRSALWGAVAAALVLLGGGGYFAWTEIREDRRPRRRSISRPSSSSRPLPNGARPTRSPPRSGGWWRKPPSAADSRSRGQPARRSRAAGRAPGASERREPTWRG